MTTQRMQEAATKVAHTIGHKDVGSTDPSAIALFKAEATPEQAEKFKNGIREVDAVNWLLKVQRELRGEMLAGRKVDLDAIATAAALHLSHETEHVGEPELTADVKAAASVIREMLAGEQKAFQAEIDANAADVKAKRKRYNVGDVLSPVVFIGKTPEQIARIIAAHEAIPVDEFVPEDTTVAQ